MTDTAAASTTDPAQLLNNFHERREYSVVQPNGNLALVNTQWITDAAPQPVWGAAGLWSPLPAGQSGLKVTAAAADGVVVDGAVVDGEAIVRGKDTDAPSTIAFIRSMCRSISAATSASLFGKYWYSDPIETPAALATPFVVSPSKPCASAPRAASGTARRSSCGSVVRTRTFPPVYCRVSKAHSP